MIFWCIATRFCGVIYQKTVFIITTMRSQNTLMKWIIECSQPTVTSAPSLVQIFLSLRDIPDDSVISPPPPVKTIKLFPKFHYDWQLKTVLLHDMSKSCRNCYLIKTKTRLKMSPVAAWFACAIMPALHLGTFVACCSVRMKCEILHTYKWLNLWLYIF